MGKNTNRNHSSKMPRLQFPITALNRGKSSAAHEEVTVKVQTTNKKLRDKSTETHHNTEVIRRDRQRNGGRQRRSRWSRSNADFCARGGYGRREGGRFNPHRPTVLRSWTLRCYIRLQDGVKLYVVSAPLHLANLDRRMKRKSDRRDAETGTAKATREQKDINAHKDTLTFNIRLFCSRSKT